MAIPNTVAAVIDLVGSQKKLAKAAGVSQQAVSRWLTTLRRIPAEYVVPISASTGIPKRLIRPDLVDLNRSNRRTATPRRKSQRMSAAT